MCTVGDIFHEVNSEYDYDTLGRLLSAKAFNETFSFAYRDTENDVGYSVTYPNGTVQDWHVDTIGDLNQISYAKSGESISSFDYGFNNAGQLATLNSSEALPLSNENYKATYNALNQVDTWNDENGIFVYDADGNLTQGLLSGNVPFTANYDAENRLTAIQFIKNGISIEELFSYQYNHFLAKYERKENNVVVATKQFIRLGLIELQELDAQGNITAENAWRLDMPGGVGGLLSRQQGVNKYTYITNHLGHVYGVLDSEGNRLSTHAYTPYGSVIGDDFGLQPFGMSTKRSDFESGLVYFGYRFYMPNTGRWLNRDPLQEAGGINLYAYVMGDPLGYVDPDGNSVIVGTLCVIAGSISEYASWTAADMNNSSLDLLQDLNQKLNEEISACDQGSNRHIELQNIKDNVDKLIRDEAMKELKENGLISLDGLAGNLTWAILCGIAWVVPSV